MDLGPRSETVSQGDGRFLSYDDADEKGVTITGTVGVNSCSGVIIKGPGGTLFAHLDPIEPNDDESYLAFEDAVQKFVIDLFNNNKDKLQGGTMYVSVPNNQVGENTVLGEAAEELGIVQVYTSYDPINQETYESREYEASGKGTMWIDFSDKANPQVVIFGQTQTV